MTDNSIRALVQSETNAYEQGVSDAHLGHQHGWSIEPNWSRDQKDAYDRGWYNAAGGM